MNKFLKNKVISNYEETFNIISKTDALLNKAKQQMNQGMLFVALGVIVFGFNISLYDVNAHIESQIEHIALSVGALIWIGVFCLIFKTQHDSYKHLMQNKDRLEEMLYVYKQHLRILVLQRA